MSLQDVYQGFLADPKPASLAPDASLLYITTTTKFDQADAIISHLQKQRNVVKKKSETLIHAIEGAHSLCVDVETTLEFVTGGGAYLPSLDDNFLADRIATFPAVHIVQFNAQRQIQQIRLYWEQGSLLKQIEVIGARGRNWPIRDAKDQTRMIKSAVVSEPVDDAPTFAPSQPSNTETELDDSQRPASPTKKRIKDPYAAESLFDLLSPGKEGKDRDEPVRAPRARANAQPAPRDYGELFVSHDQDTPEASPSKQAIHTKAGAGKNYQQSRIFNDEDPTETPSKAVAPKGGSNHGYKPSRIFDDEDPSAMPSAVAPKAGSSHNYKPSRIFDDDETVAAESAQTPKYRTNPNKYNHFDIGGDNEARETKAIPTRPKSQHMSQWNFEDFDTPVKPARKPRGQEIRHFGWSDDEGEAQDSPPAKPRVPQPRRDAESHFELTDAVDTPKEARMIGSQHNRGLNLYRNPLASEEDEPVERASNRPLSMVGNGVNRKKDFDSHWSMTDSPENKANGNGNAENRKPAGHDRMKAVRMMESSWESYDESPQSKPVQPKPQRASRNVNQRSWGFSDE